MTSVFEISDERKKPMETAMLQAGIIQSEFVASRATIDEMQRAYVLFKRTRAPYSEIYLFISETDFDKARSLISGYTNIGYGYDLFFCFDSVRKTIEAYTTLIENDIECSLRITRGDELDE